MVQGEDNGGKFTDSLAGCHPIQTVSARTCIIPAIFMPDSLPDATSLIYPGLGQAPSMLVCIPGGLVLLGIIHTHTHARTHATILRLSEFCQ